MVSTTAPVHFAQALVARNAAFFDLLQQPGHRLTEILHPCLFTAADRAPERQAAEQLRRADNTLMGAGGTVLVVLLRLLPCTLRSIRAGAARAFRRSAGSRAFLVGEHALQPLGARARARRRADQLRSLLRIATSVAVDQPRNAVDHGARSKLRACKLLAPRRDRLAILPRRQRRAHQGLLEHVLGRIVLVLGSAPPCRFWP